MTCPWLNFFTICGSCEIEGIVLILKKEFSPAYDKITITHGSCRYHELERNVKWGIASWTEKKDLLRMMKIRALLKAQAEKQVRLNWLLMKSISCLEIK